jgi:hypothetical protein
MTANVDTGGRGDRSFLSDLGEPRRYRDRYDQLLKTMDDPRCACAPLCPYHRIPGELWETCREKAPWHPQEP